MKLTAIILLSACLGASAKSDAQNISIRLKNSSLETIFKVIKQQTGYRFLYKDEALKVAKPVSIDVKNATLETVLSICFKDQQLTYRIFKNTIVISDKQIPALQSGDIIPSTGIPPPIDVRGRVTNEKGEPVEGASITIKGISRGTTTDANGYFTIQLPDNGGVLMISYVGYDVVETMVTKSGTFDFTLKPGDSKIEEVVVVGYGTQKKINLTGAIDVVPVDALKNRAAPNVGALLQGVSPNLNISVSPTGGEPGSGNFFNIRGVGSLTGGGAPLILVDGVEMNINNLDPETVESISVLKDAGSAAIYGSRAPFGVVLITTKKGSKTKGVSVSYTNNIAFASPISLPKWQSSLRYVTAYNQSLENSGQPHKFLEPQIDRIKKYIDGSYRPEYDTTSPPNSIWAGRHEGNANYEWFDEYFKDVTVNQKHNINISGGDERTQYYISTGFYDQGSSYNWVDEYYRRYNILANITSQATSWLRFNVNTKYSNTKTSHPNLGSDWDPGRNFLISEMIKFFPTTPFYNVNGTVNNPYVSAMQKTGDATGNENDLFISLGTEIEPITGWKTNFNYNYNYNASKNTWLDSEIWVEIPDGQVVNFWNDPNYFTQNWNSNNYNSLYGFTSYEKTIKDHFFKGMVGYERETRYFSSLYGNRRGVISEEVPSFSTATGSFALDDAMSHWATEAFFGRLNYSYKQKYLLEVNGRYNGSSRFAKDSRWGFFPSVSAGYIISNESYWKPLQNYVSYFKFRGSYGSLGNQNVPNYLYLSNIPINTNLEWIVDNDRPNYAGLPAIISSSLTWETVNTLNFGVEVNFLKNRLGIVFDWFRRNTLHMFGPSTILPNSLGTNPPLENNASLVTKGWEFSLDWKDRISNDLFYSVRLNVADSRSRVSKYLNKTGQIDEYYIGKEIGEIWGYTTSGLIQSDNEEIADQSFFYNKWGPGDIRYSDLSGDKIINDGNRTLDDHGDLSVIGNSSPRYSIGFSGTVSWKNFDFSMFWQGIIKRNLVPGSNMWWGIATQGDNGGAFYQGHDNYWRPADETNLFGPNTDAFYAKPYVTQETYKNQQTQTRYLLNAGYFRLKNLQLGYNIPRTFTNKIKLEALRIYVSGENLVTFDKLPPYIDPETSFASTGFAGSWMLGAIYPLSRSISFGLNVTF